ncbi:MAG: hypothetical protein AB1567_07440 [bacterium]
MKGNSQLQKRYENEIEQLHNLVIEQADSKNVAEECLQILCQARMALSMDDQVETEYYISLTKSLLVRAKKSKEYQESHGRNIVLYELLCLAILLLLIPTIIFRFKGEEVLLLVGVPIQYYIWGGIGGIMAALYGFVRHASQRTLDVQFVQWYYIKPVLGIIIGPIIYLLFTCIVFAMGGDIDHTKPNFLILLACWIAGFSERFSLGMLDAIMDTMLNISTKRKIQMQKVEYTGIEKK